VLRVASSFRLALAARTVLTCADAAKKLLNGKRAWEVRSAGKGSKGERWYAWAWLATASWRHSLLIRRHLKTGELAFHYCCVPEQQAASKTRLIRAAGLRWPVEVGHRWHRSSDAAFSRLCSLFLVGFLFLFWRCPAGTGVEAGRAGPALA
jgi:hypothetical protein